MKRSKYNNGRLEEISDGERKRNTNDSIVLTHIQWIDSLI